MTNKKIVEQWIKNNRYYKVEDIELRTYIEWDIKLWRKTYDEIVEYLMKRFERTNNTIEYYYCLLYLEKHLPEKLRYLPYEESNQHKRAIGIEVDNSKVQRKFKTVNTFNVVK